MSAVIFWIIVAAVVIAIDMVTSNFLFAWFAVGAFVAMIADLLGVTFGVQVVLFLVVNLITVSVGYPWAKRKFKEGVKRTPLMEENYIGRVMKAEEEIVDRAKIKVDGIYWTVQNSGEVIKKDESFKITGIEGIKLIIKKEEEV
ncbi:MAG: NfeD family protein [Clostridium sp.]|uniref:NfeD family protein n=1 Tax=Clostridium sp. TaxID=1506 RepID=UPI001EB9DE98|nr:NfeD family protein [Clostridium sp.]MBS5885034.1 NfeD family protein [Clostridium sp.]MDU7148530.1 NfeD family protein [Clostridium sp.]MDU7241819.1 NfeD family protein [Clostridium sp.]